MKKKKKKERKKYRVGVKTCKDKGLRGRVEEGEEMREKRADGDAERWDREPIRGKVGVGGFSDSPGVHPSRSLRRSVLPFVRHSSLFVRQAAVLIREKHNSAGQKPWPKKEIQ